MEGPLLLAADAYSERFIDATEANDFLKIYRVNGTLGIRISRVIQWKFSILIPTGENEGGELR